MGRLHILGIAAVVWLFTLPATALANSQGYATNLRTCLSGSMRSLCDHSILLPQDVERVEKAEYQANLRTCLSGSMRSLCDHSILLPQDVERVEKAEYQANLRTCLSGSMRSLCDHSILLPQDIERVEKAEYQANLRTCLSGYLRTLCNHSILLSQDAERVQKVERHERQADELGVAGLSDGRLPSVGTTTSHTPSSSLQVGTESVENGPACAENGSCYGDISAVTNLPKTIHVDGYFRKDGTYVRGHYRSRKR